jgi:hypothetical protein
MKTPKGWRKLRKGTVIRKGDKYFCPMTQNWWYSGNIGLKVGFTLSSHTYIRRTRERKV